MKCPRCVVELRISNRQAIEIDICPKCRGVWLDRGELDKILERANATHYFIDDDDDDDLGPQGGDNARGRSQLPRPAGKRRESFWSNLFHFD
ncbi:MAG: zf-TFIIB domain-containing protein [Pirellulales bacterium]